MNTQRGIFLLASAMIRLLFVAGFVASMGLTQAQTSVPLVPMGAVWKYLDTGVDQGTAWITPGFNDSTWPSGPAQLGYGDGDEATTVSFGPDPNNKYITSYFRHSFVVNVYENQSRSPQHLSYRSRAASHSNTDTTV